MALPLSGAISHSTIMGEFGKTGEFDLSADGATLIGKSPSTLIAETDFYGASDGIFDSTKTPSRYGEGTWGTNASWGNGGSGSPPWNMRAVAKGPGNGQTDNGEYNIAANNRVAAGTYRLDYNVTVAFPVADNGGGFSLYTNTYVDMLPEGHGNRVNKYDSVVGNKTQQLVKSAFDVGLFGKVSWYEKIVGDTWENIGGTSGTIVGWTTVTFDQPTNIVFRLYAGGAGNGQEQVSTCTINEITLT